MTINTTIRLLMEAHGITQTTMAKMCGLKAQNRIAMRLQSPNLSINNCMEMLDILGYEIVVREAHSGRRREDEIIITMEDEV